MELLQLTNWLDQHKLFRCGDEAEEVRAHISHVFAPHNLNVVGKCDKLNADMNHLNLGSISINTLQYGAEVSVNCNPVEDFLLMMIPMTGIMNISLSKDSFISSRNQAALMNPSDTLAMEWESGCKQLILQINKDLINRTCESFLGYPIKNSVEFAHAMEIKNGVELYENIIKLIVSNPFIAKSAKSYPLLTKQIEQLLVSSLLFGQNNQYHKELTSPEKIIIPSYIKRAEEYMIEHASDPISTSDVAKCVGISLRSLYAGFQKYKNISPKVFLRTLRLDLAKKDLLEAKLTNRTESKHTTVTDIALRWGYPHLSHFSESYYTRHGEYPSDTLKK